MSDLDWTKAEAHLQEVRRQYTEIGAAGVPGLTMVLNPLAVRLERAMRDPTLRTETLYAEIMATQ